MQKASSQQHHLLFRNSSFPVRLVPNFGKGTWRVPLCCKRELCVCVCGGGSICDKGEKVLLFATSSWKGGFVNAPIRKSLTSRASLNGHMIMNLEI